MIFHNAMRTLVIDDEALSRKRILNLLREESRIEIMGECSNGKSALAQIQKCSPDLIFLDINMKDMTGFEVLKNIEIVPKPIVIFVTAHGHHALRAFDFDAFDFLLKPYKDERFFRTLEKALKLSKKEAESNFDKRMGEFLKLMGQNPFADRGSHKIPIRQGNKTLLLETHKISHILASGYYAEIFADDRKFLLRESLGKLMEILDRELFFRIHRSAIVNVNYLKEIVHSDYSEIDVRMVDGKLIRVSKSKKKEFLKKLGI